MAITLSNHAGLPTASGFGGLTVKFMDILMDNNYPAGGYTLNPSDVGLDTIYFAVFQPNIVQFAWESNKIKAYRNPAHTHTENTAASYTQNATTGQASTVSSAEPAGANLTGVTVRAMFVGLKG